MYLIPVVLLLVMSAGVGWSIGANDAANSLGTAVGAKVLTLRQGIVLIAAFGFLGAFLQGSYVVKTVGNGIVPLDNLDKNTALYLAVIACFASCAWVVLATYWKIPVSTSHAIVGAVAGAGLAINAPIKWKMFLDIFICWFLTPIGSAVLGYLFYLVFKNIFNLFLPQRYQKQILTVLVIISGCYVAYSWGANDVANATGIVAGTGILTPQMSIVFGALAIVLGILTWGYKVIETIGSCIANLLPLMAFCAQLASAINVHVYSVLGMPVSTSHSIVGAIIGVGLVKGTRVVNARVLKEIAVCWLSTPFVSGLISFLVFKAVMVFVKI